MSKTNLFSFSQTFGDSNKLQNRSKWLEAKNGKVNKKLVYPKSNLQFLT